jgi:ribonuclease I
MVEDLKIGQNRSKAWAIVHGFWPKMPQNACFFALGKYFKWCQNTSKSVIKKYYMAM